jgi:hypothetical protein
MKAHANIKKKNDLLSPRASKACWYKSCELFSYEYIICHAKTNFSFFFF